MKARRLVVTVTLGLAAAAGGLAGLPEPPGPVSRLELSIVGPVVTGAPLEVLINSDLDVEVTLLFCDAYSTSVTTVTQTAPTLRVPGPTARRAGRLEVIAVAGGRVASDSTEIVPGPVAGPTPPLVGARSIVADGVDRAMVVVVPTDSLGNPVPPGTQVEISVQHPDGSVDDRTASVERTVAWTWVPSVTTAGTAIVTAHSGGEPTGETLIEVPAAPRPFSLLVETGLRRADGTSYITVASEVLVDGHGNRILDGSEARVQARYPDGSVSLQTVMTIGGVARAVLEAPDTPGLMRVEMIVQGVASTPLRIDFSAPLPGAESRVRPQLLKPSSPLEGARR